MENNLDTSFFKERVTFLEELSWNSCKPEHFSFATQEDWIQTLATKINHGSAKVFQYVSSERGEGSNPLVYGGGADAIIVSEYVLATFIEKLGFYSTNPKRRGELYAPIVNFDNFKTVGILAGKYEVVVFDDFSMPENTIYVLNKNHLVGVKVNFIE